MLFFIKRYINFLKTHLICNDKPCFVFKALLTFSDGRYIGAILDRNGLRPSRFYVTKDNHMYMSSEVGVTDCKSSEVIQKVQDFFIVVGLINTIPTVIKKLNIWLS